MPFLRSDPQVVATISTLAGWTSAVQLNPEAPDCPNLLEVRADLLLQNDADLPGSLLDLPLPFILTVRHPSEGGQAPLDTESRMAVYRRFWGNAAAIDLELATALELGTVVTEAKQRGVACVLSFHDFADTPSLAHLHGMAETAGEWGADLFKVASTTDDVRQLCTLLSWVESEKKLPVAAMGMGRLGKLSRPLLAQLGSQLNYGYLDAPVVPGQWPAEELRRLLNSLL